MGISTNFLSLLPSLWPSFSLFLLLLFMSNFSFLIALANTTTTTTSTSMTSTAYYDDGESSGNSPTPLAPPPQLSFRTKGSPFRPSIAVIVGVLTTVFSVTFLLLLYAKHCRRGGDNSPLSSTSRIGYPAIAARKNSGIDRAVIESLPVFRFASLRGQKDGLECAVCLNKFEHTEVLRLLPKCKHAFHVECVDTWLDAHSTCPLCRYRVDPEDILLVEDNRVLYQNDTPPLKSSSVNHPTPELGSISRVSGRHSFAGNSLEVIAETPRGGDAAATSFGARRSLDSWNSRKKRNSEMVGVGCFDRPRKDELLLGDKTSGSGSGAEQRRLEHRIIISGGRTEVETADGPNHRWSDVQPSDLLFLRSEMILGDSRRFSGSRGSRPSFSSSSFGCGEINAGKSSNNSSSGGRGGGRNVINTRSVSEITGMSRFRSNEDEQQHQQQQRLQRQQRQAGAVSRWMAWVSQSQNQQHHHNHHHHHHQPAAHRTSSSSSVNAV
ncbi:RING-H2 finger protein ATL43 [Coffea eugenioides]|uniref:RING-H2 finger protein ATL43 n=1 Tax=Coffea eugenioides TaxID=49369 RepID=UPI000F60E833|nr:RING-H2 finger protein ATL43 [Coffea eugenioides]